MKRKIDILVCLLTITLIGCKPQTHNVELPKRTVISGQIGHLEVYPTTKELFAEVVDFRDRKSVFKDSISDNGTFKIVFDLYACQDVKINPLIDRIILHPGDSIFVKMDFSDISRVLFTGDRVETNNALRKYLWSNAGIVGFYTAAKPEPFAYKVFCDSILNDGLKLQKDFIKKENPPEELIQWTSDYLTINYYKALLSYPRNYFMRDVKGYKEWFNASTVYFNFAGNIENSYRDFGKTIVNSNMYQLLESYNSWLIEKTTSTIAEGMGYSLGSITNTILTEHQNTVFRQMLLAKQYHQLLESNQLKPFDYSKKLLDSIIQEPFIREPLYGFYNEQVKNAEHPEYGSNAILSKMGIEGKVLLDSIIAENKGKVLFVDLWATWCGPCLEGMKSAKEIMPRYNKKDIEFIFLCVNSNEETWKATLSGFKIDGKHYFCNNDQSRDIRRALGVEEIPHYIIIDKQGHIVDPDSPDLAHALGIIEKLLNKTICL